MVIAKLVEEIKMENPKETKEEKRVLKIHSEKYYKTSPTESLPKTIIPSNCIIRSS